MECLWTRGPSSVAEVREALSAPLAYTTVLTILRNLEGKGAAGRWGAGRGHRYFALVSRDDARERAVRALADRFFGGRRQGLMAYLAQAGAPVGE